MKINSSYLVFVFCLLHICSTISLCSNKPELVDALELTSLLKTQQISNVNVVSSRVIAVAYQGAFPTVTSWLLAFRALPKNRQGADFSKHSGFSVCGDKAKQWSEFKGVLESWLKMNSEGPLSKEDNWSSIAPKTIFNFLQGPVLKPAADFFDTTKPCAFAPFAQKLITNQGDVFYLHGDLHGDIFSLLEEIKELRARGIIDDNFRITQDKVWLVFLGDYVDRGKYGCEVIYTMMRLALANPDRVISVRGNHEDMDISSRYGFRDEVAAKFNDDAGLKYAQISRMNDLLPVVFYLGCVDDQGVVNYVQCCHGGIEEEYKPQRFLDDFKTIYQLLPKFSDEHSKTCPFEDNKIPLGFMWSDFDVDHQDTDYKLNPSRGFIYGKVGTERVLQALQSSVKSKIRGILRAHQHSGSIQDSMMKGLVESNGLYKLWQPYEKVQIRHLDDGLVWTFNVGPDSVYGDGVGFNFDTYVALTTARAYKDWTMKVFNTKIL